VSQLAAGDVDGTGVDLLTWVYTSAATTSESAWAVLFQQPDGSFLLSGVLGPQIGVNIETPWRIADANGDGRRDLLAYLTRGAPITAPVCW